MPTRCGVASVDSGQALSPAAPKSKLRRAVSRPPKEAPSSCEQGTRSSSSESKFKASRNSLFAPKRTLTFRRRLLSTLQEQLFTFASSFPPVAAAQSPGRKGASPLGICA
eukprot:4076703-Pleurochrysis_carterae.AAC.1